MWLFEESEVSPDPLAASFVLPPFSVLRAENEGWKRRRSFWTSLGIKSEQGRDDNLLNLSETARAQGGDGTSIFDPVLCELAYRWWCPPGGTVLDPFAGGLVRGLVACHERHGLGYVGNTAPPRADRGERAPGDELARLLTPARPRIEGDALECSRASQPPTRASTCSLPAPPTSTSNATGRPSGPLGHGRSSPLRGCAPGGGCPERCPPGRGSLRRLGRWAMCATGALASCGLALHRHRCSPRRGPPALQ